ncbi:MAG: sigma-70 family RNA polymerase sigma factor [Deltaproteobacteria bacterium]|nr:sigma-70 family RNA polymerase sigma factor [Deltaproteobacteria bacterium]
MFQDRPRPAASLRHRAAPSRLRDETAAIEPVVRGLVARMLREGRDHPDVSDCCHEAFRRALEAEERVRDGAPLRPWVLGIARHVALDALRARGRARREAEAGGAPAAADALACVPDPAPGPEALLALAQDARRVRAALDGLGEEQRRVLWLFHVEGLGYREIAERLAIPLGTVCTWLMRGRQRLARALQERASEL